MGLRLLAVTLALLAETVCKPPIFKLSARAWETFRAARKKFLVAWKAGGLVGDVGLRFAKPTYGAWRLAYQEMGRRHGRN